MSKDNEIYKIKVLIYFYNNRHSTVTKIAGAIGKEKYFISRVLRELAENGLIDKSNPRSPVLTEKGLKTARDYNRKLSLISEHLLDSGADPASVSVDAFMIAKACSDQTLSKLCEMQLKKRLIKSLPVNKEPSGMELCRRAQDGICQVQPYFYRSTSTGMELSPANGFFKRAIRFEVNGEAGKLYLQLSDRSDIAVLRVSYSVDCKSTGCEKSGSVFHLPVSALRFKVLTDGVVKNLHASVPLEIEYRDAKQKEHKLSVLMTLIF